MTAVEQALTTQPEKPANVVNRHFPGLKTKDYATHDLPRLTTQQLAFVEALTDGNKTYTDAFLEAYPSARKWPRHAVWANASGLAAHHKVSKWLDRAWEAKQQATDRTIRGHLNRLERAQNQALTIADALEDKDKLNALKVALEAEKQHAQALGLTQEKQSGGVTINLVSFAEQDVSVSSEGQTVTLSPSDTGDSDR